MAVAASIAVGCGSDDETSTEPTKLDPQQVIERAGPAVVQLYGKQGNQDVGGTGVVYDAEGGLVLTNSHVVNAVSGLKAKVGDQTAVSARVVGQAPCDDVAVVELDGSQPGLEALTLGDSAEVKPGEHVTALGYPSNFSKPNQQDVIPTDGAVSDPDVSSTTIDPALPKYGALIQHQAALNPGNSGGPLVNDLGEVIGINALGPSKGSGLEGQSYAISIDQVEALLDELEGGVSPGDVGWNLVPLERLRPGVLAADFKLEFGDVIKPVLAEKLVRRKSEGLYVLGSLAGSPAREAKLIRGDLITAIDGRNVKSVPEVCSILESTTPGQKLDVSGKLLSSGRASDFFKDRSFTVELKIPDEEASPSAAAGDAGTTDTQAAP